MRYYSKHDRNILMNICSDKGSHSYQWITCRSITTQERPVILIDSCYWIKTDALRPYNAARSVSIKHVTGSISNWKKQSTH